MNNEFEMAIKDFVRNGGVVLAANHNANIVGVKGDMSKVDEYLIKVLLGISVSVIKNNPKAFEVMAAVIVVHLCSAVKIAEQNYNVPNLAKDVMYRIVGALTDEDITYMTTLSAKRILEDIEKSGKVWKIEK